MATWQEFCDGAKKFTKKVADKTEKMADIASLSLKLTQKEAAISNLYEDFGKLAYDQIKHGGEHGEDAEKLIAKLDTLNAEIEALKAEIQTKKEENK